MAELVAKRYGTAIFELAKEEDAVDALEEEILAVRGSFEDKDLIEFLSHPKVAIEEKVSVLEASLSDKVSHDLLGLLVLIVKKSRQSDILDIFDEVLHQIDGHKGKVKAYISSADDLSTAQKTKILGELAALTSKEIIPQYEVDADLIGGLIIRIGDRIVDNSIKGHLHSLSRELIETKI